MTMAMRTIRDMEFNRPTDNNTAKTGKKIDAHGMRVQVAENSREMWWMGLDKKTQVQGALAMPMEMVPEIVQAMLDYTSYYNQHGKAHFYPTAGDRSGDKITTALKFFVVHREERGEIVFALIAGGFDPDAQKNNLHQPENFKTTFAEALQDWFNDSKMGEELRKKYDGKFNLLNVLTDLWPLPEKLVGALRDKGVRIYSIGVQQWLTQSAWNIDDNLLGNAKEETVVPDDAPAGGVIAVDSPGATGSTTAVEARANLTQAAQVDPLNPPPATGTSMEGHPEPGGVATVETVESTIEEPTEENTAPATLPPPPPLPADAPPEGQTTTPAPGETVNA